MNERTPRQQLIFDRLFDGVRPWYEDGFAAGLRARVEDALRESIASLDGEQLRVGKSPLDRVHRCEGFYEAQRDAPFERTVSLIGGTVAHRMIAVMLGAGEQTPSLGLADRVVQRMIDDPDTRDDGAFLRDLEPIDMADVKALATNASVTFASDWPAEVRRWKPRLDLPVRVDLLGGRLRLQGKPDLVLGTPNGLEARLIVIDLKTGGQHATHMDDLRYYALLQTLRDGVPPFRVASYYLQEGEIHCEDVSAETLDAAARRLIDGVGKIVELNQRAPQLNAGWHCTWCPIRNECETGSAFLDSVKNGDAIAV